MSRPLLITDCDEVLLHMVVPFQGWLDEVKHVHFDLEKGDFVDALRHKHDGTVVPPETVWPMLQEFFIHAKTQFGKVGSIGTKLVAA